MGSPEESKQKDQQGMTQSGTEGSLTQDGHPQYTENQEDYRTVKSSEFLKPIIPIGKQFIATFK